MDRSVGGVQVGSTGEWIDGWTDGWIDRRIDGWMGKYVVRLDRQGGWVVGVGMYR